MKTKHFYGSTAENDALLLPNGMISIDGEKKAVRWHDGQTVGGYEALAERAVPNMTGTGPQTLVAGDMTAGFFGEVTSSELLTYEDLATQIGLSAGTSINNTESLWLKFALDEKVLYVAKKPARYGVTWDQINTVNAVFERGVQIGVGTDLFDVTLLRGASSNPTADATGWDIPTSHGSEWNRLLYPVHSGIHGNTSNPNPHTDPNAAPFGSWAQYSDNDIVVTGTPASRTWCQEGHPGRSGGRVNRGNSGITQLVYEASHFVRPTLAWRPVLRLAV